MPTPPDFHPFRFIPDPRSIPVEGSAMHNEPHDCFVVYVREGSGAGAVERPVAACPSYQEAAGVRRHIRLSGGTCVIRFVGLAGGGD